MLGTCTGKVSGLFAVFFHFKIFTHWQISGWKMEFLNRWFLCKKCRIYIRGLEAYIPHRKQASCRPMIPTAKLNRMKKIEEPMRNQVKASDSKRPKKPLPKFNINKANSRSNHVEPASKQPKKPPKEQNLRSRKVSTPKIKKPHECLLCPSSFDFKSYLQHHQRMHTGEKPYKCDICAKAFTWKSVLEKHLRKKHAEALLNRCAFCEKDFYDVKSLECHTKRCHTGFFAKNPQLREACKTCSICQKVLKSKHDMRRHKRDVHFSQRLKFPKCPKQLKSNRILRDHIQAVHGGERPFKCQVCGEAFHSKHGLTRHSTIHEPAKKKESFRCHYCNMSLASLWRLKIHERIHTGEKPFECSVCDSRFRSCRMLDRHSKKVHSIEKV